MMENIDAIDRLEKHNRTYVPGASEENNNGKFLGPDEIDLLVDAHRIEREEKEMREKYFRFLPPISSRRKELEEFSLAERLLGDVPHLFATKILTKLDDQDVAVFSRCSKRIRRLVRNEFGETKYAKLCVRKFASSKEGVAYAKWCGVPMTTRTFASIARVGNVEALDFALDAGWPHDAKAATACARGNHFETLRWMRANGLKWDKKKVLVVAMENRNVDMAEWIMMQKKKKKKKKKSMTDQTLRLLKVFTLPTRLLRLSSPLAPLSSLPKPLSSLLLITFSQTSYRRLVPLSSR